MKLKEVVTFVHMSNKDREEFVAMNKNREKKGLSPWSKEKFLRWKETHRKGKYERITEREE
jgi:hypothetical protein